MARRSSALGDLLGLLWPFIGRKPAAPALIKWFYGPVVNAKMERG
jgi:hypothetical protein